MADVDNGDPVISPSAVLIGRRRDPELASLGAALGGLGTPYLRIDIDWLDDLRVVLDPVGAGVLHTEAGAVRPTIVWAKDLSSRAMSSDPAELDRTYANDTAWALTPRASAADPGQVEAAFVGASRAAFLFQLASGSPAFFPGVEPARLRQLADARQLGIRVPSTVVATDPSQAPPTWKRVVVKALDEHYVEHASELRAYYIGGRLCTFRVGKDLPTDQWLATGRVTVAPVLTPPNLRVAVTALARRWGLRYGAFDFLVDNAGPPADFYARGLRVRVAWANGTNRVNTGNSFAAPHIAGICALILGKHRWLTPFQLKTVLFTTSSNGPWDPRRQSGREGEKHADTRVAG